MHATPIEPIAWVSDNPTAVASAIDFDRYLPFLIVSTANRLSSTASRLYLSRFGVGVTAWRILANLKALPDMTANEICAASNLDKGPVSRAVASLVESGDIVLNIVDHDRRKRPLHLAPKGAALHDRILAEALARQRRLLAGLDPAEVDALLRALAIVHHNAQELD